MRITRTMTVPAVAACAALMVAGCGNDDSKDKGGSSSNASSSANGGSSASAGDANAAPVKNGVSQVAITLTSSGCAIDHPSAKAGPITFTVTNKDAAGISEVELQSDQRIIGEKENLAPGLAPVSFTSTLGGGAYQVYCPGAEKDTVPFTVTGKAAAAPTGDAATLLKKGADQYGKYVTDEVTGMVDGVAKLDAAIQSGNLDEAKKQYAASRVFYEKIESDVDGFVLPGFKAGDNAGNLDYLIDMRQSNLDPKVGWHGFHAIERDLWKDGKISDTTKKMSTELKANVGKLQSLSKGITYKPEDLANGASDLLDEVQKEKIKGEEEAFSHLDLVDFNANVEGAQQAFAYLKPGLDKLDPTLSKTVSTKFTEVKKSLDGYRDTNAIGGFKPWTAQLRTKDSAGLSKTVQGLQDPLSRIAQKVATAG